MANLSDETIIPLNHIDNRSKNSPEVVSSISLLSDRYIIPVDYLVQVCRYRQGTQCCRYIVFSDLKQEFCCAKRISSIKKFIDSEAGMSATGDNCSGLPAK